MDTMSPTIETIEISEIYIDHDFNSRGQISATSVSDLADSIASDGLIQPVVVSLLDEGEKLIWKGYKYKLIAGFRRTHAHKLLKRTVIEAVVRPAMSEYDARIINLKENIDRKDLNILQEANVVEYLLTLKVNGKQLIQMDVAQKLNKSPTWVNIRAMLKALPEDVQREAEVGNISQGNIKDLYNLRLNPSEMYAAVRVIKERKERKESPIKIFKPNETLNKKRRRSTTEIFKLINLIVSVKNETSLLTRGLAWTAGEISDGEVYNDIKAWAESQGYDFEIPVVSIANLGETKIEY
jgi:ParB/RepB/Spo0J family partition protein